MKKLLGLLLVCAVLAWAGVGIKAGPAFPEIGDETETVWFLGGFFQGEKTVWYELGVEWWKWSESVEQLSGEIQVVSFPVSVGLEVGALKLGAGFDVINMMKTKLALDDIIEEEATEWNWLGGYHLTASLWHPLSETFEAGLVGKVNWQTFGSEEIDTEATTWSIGAALLFL